MTNRATAEIETSEVTTPLEALVSGRSPTLEVHGLSISFRQYTNGLRRRVLQVISGLDLDVMPGELVAVVGSSGSGKSLLAHAILGLLPSNAVVSGRMLFQGRRMTSKLQEELRGREISLVPQSVSWLDPLMRVGRQVQSAVRQGDSRAAQRTVFERYQLADGVGRMYPFQLSGGMARRTLVATAVVAGAKLIIADEPTPGLDRPAVTEALGHLRELANAGAAVMLITHDIDAGLSVADRVAVFYAGTTIEVAPAADFAASPTALRHPYSRALWRALPKNDFEPLPGSQPAPGESSSGCPFHPRCSLKNAECLEAIPGLRNLRNGRVRCVHAT